MDPVKIGKFIAKLRKEKNMTQEQLGEALGVTNKTVSRWETGNYMPGIEMLRLLSELFDVSINELLSGECISDEKFRSKADENLLQVAKEHAFSLEEQKRFWIHKWCRDHVSLLILLGVVPVLMMLFALFTDMDWCFGLSPLIALIEYSWQNNQMMIYVEKQLYGK